MYTDCSVGNRIPRGKVKIISIQGGSNIHTQGRDSPSPHLIYNGWNSRPGAEHRRNNPVGPLHTLLTRALRSITSKGKMNRESRACRTNSRSTLPPSWSCCRLSHVRWGGTGRVHRPVISDEDHRPAAALLQRLSYSPSSCYISPCGGLLSLKVQKGKSVAVKARGILTWVAHRM